MIEPIVLVSGKLALKKKKKNYPAIQRGSYMVSGAALERENIKKDPWFATSLGNL